MPTCVFMPVERGGYFEKQGPRRNGKNGMCASDSWWQGGASQPLTCNPGEGMVLSQRP